MQATVSNYNFIMRNVASKCMFILLFVKCKKSFQSFQHAKNQFFGVCNRLLACQGGSCGKTEFYFIDHIFHLFILDWIFFA